MTTNQISSAIRRKILEETTDLVTDDTILLNANLAYDDLRYRTFTNDQVMSASITLTNGVGTLPTDFGTLYDDAFDSSGNSFPEKSIADFDKDTLSNGVVIEGGTLKANPANYTGVLTIKYYPSYATLTTTQNPEIHQYLQELIIYGALHRIHEDLQDEVLSKYYGEKYEEELNKRTGVMSNYEEGNQRGGEMFTYQRLI